MKSTVTWTGNRSFEGKTEDGFSVALGQSTETSPKPGPSAMELILIGTGGCSIYDVVSILEKGRQDVEDVRVEMSADRADAVPAVFTKIHMHFVVTGRGVKDSLVERAVSLSAEKYCSATKMLQANVEITHGFEIIEA
ncbi:MAG: OsmC family protein [Boseongicola sp.]|nr:OsmC family protein [Boseongicola sp.]NNL18210.1 OsmC family protein [Boseongicola sp.]